MFVSGKFCDGYVVFRKICDFFYFLFLRFSSSPQCLCQGSSATGMWFSGRFVIFLFPVPPLFFFSAMFVSGKFRDGYAFSGRFIIFSFSLSSPVPPLSCSSVFQPPFFVLFPLFLYFYIFLSMYKKTPLLLCWRQSVGCLIKGKGVFFRIYISNTVWNRKMSWCFALKVSKINLCVETGPILRRPFWRKGSNIQEAEIYIGRIQMLTEIRPKFAVSGISRLSRGRK